MEINLSRKAEQPMIFHLKPNDTPASLKKRAPIIFERMTLVHNTIVEELGNNVSFEEFFDKSILLLNICIGLQNIMQDNKSLINDTLEGGAFYFGNHILGELKKVYRAIAYAGKIGQTLKSWWICCQGGPNDCGCGTQGFDIGYTHYDEHLRREYKACLNCKDQGSKPYPLLDVRVLYHLDKFDAIQRELGWPSCLLAQEKINDGDINDWGNTTEKAKKQGNVDSRSGKNG
jgi:hypothetical protein